MTGPHQIVLLPAQQSYLGLPGPLLQLLMLLVALGAFAWIINRRAALLRRGAPDPRLDNIGARVKRALVVGFGQSRQPRYRVAGILHILIFFGFLVLSLRSLTLIGEGFSAGFTLPGLGGALGGAYALLKEWTALVVILCCVVAAVRRLAVKPARYHDRNATGSHTGEALLILGLISFLMVADTLYEASHAVLGGEAVPYAVLYRWLNAEVGRPGPLATAPASLLRSAGRAADRLRRMGLPIPFTEGMAVAVTAPAYYSSARASHELGLRLRPAREAVADHAAWYRARGWI